MSHSIPNKYEHVHLHTYTLNVFAENEYNKEKKKYSIKMKMCFKNQTSQPKSSAQLADFIRYKIKRSNLLMLEITKNIENCEYRVSIQGDEHY